MESSVRPRAGTRAPRRVPRSSPARWPKRIAIVVPILAFLALGAFVGGRWYLDRLLHSDDFRHFLDGKMSGALHAQAHLAPLRWQSSEVYSPGVTVRAAQGGPLTSFDADEARANFDFSALWRRVWRVDFVSVERVAAEFSNRATDKTASAPAPVEQVPAPGADHSLLASLLPNKLEIGEVRVNDLSLSWTGDQPAECGRLEKVRVTAHMLGDVRNWEFDGHGGTFAQGNLPPITLDGAALKTTETTLFITRANGRTDAGGKVDIAGTQALQGDKTLDLTINFDGVGVEPFLPVDWRGRLHGKGSGHARLTGSPENAQSWRSDGHVEIHEGVVEALPVLDQLAIFADSARYRHATVQKGVADFTWTPDRLAVRNLVLESEGLLRVEGDFTVNAAQIDGYFRVGVAITSVHWINDIGAAVFDLPEHDGYAWTTMHLTGPVNNPHEDLSGRMAASAEQGLMRKAKEGTNAVLDTASGLLDLLKPQ